MFVREAKAIAAQWVRVHGAATAGFAGAFFHGSVNWLADDAALPAGSDLDVMIVLVGESSPPKPGKFVYRDVLLEVSYLAASAVQSAQQVLSEYNLAGSFHTPSVILDPTGHLTRLNQAVAAAYAQRRWVEARSRQALRKVEIGLQRINASAPFHEQVMGWLFATGVTTHVLLAAGLRNPTVRTRYGAARTLLAAYDRLDAYPMLLSWLGCEELTPEQASLHLDALEPAFDLAAQVIRTPFPFASDLSEAARVVAIDGSRDLIAAGLHREAVFWLVATGSRCMMVFDADAPADVQRQVRVHAENYRRLLADLGLASYADLRRRADSTLGALPDLWALAQEIMAANSDIQENGTQIKTDSTDER